MSPSGIAAAPRRWTVSSAKPGSHPRAAEMQRHGEQDGHDRRIEKVPPRAPRRRHADEQDAHGPERDFHADIVGEKDGARPLVAVIEKFLDQRQRDVAVIKDARREGKRPPLARLAHAEERRSEVGKRVAERDRAEAHGGREQEIAGLIERAVAEERVEDQAGEKQVHHDPQQAGVRRGAQPADPPDAPARADGEKNRRDREEQRQVFRAHFFAGTISLYSLASARISNSVSPFGMVMIPSRTGLSMTMSTT